MKVKTFREGRGPGACSPENFQKDWLALDCISRVLMVKKEKIVRLKEKKITTTYCSGNNM